MPKFNNNKDESLTLGEASCLVLGMIPNKKNRGKAKKIIEESKNYEVSYKRNSSPFKPFIIGKRVKRMNPFLYKTYAITPPSSPSPFGIYIDNGSKVWIQFKYLL